MQNILMILTSTLFGEVALVTKNSFVSKKFTEPASHTKMLIVNIEKLLKEQGLLLTDIDIIAVDRGPGSHTGIRIGLITAQMLSFRYKIPVVGISSLDNLAMAAASIISDNKQNYYTTIMPVISCRKGELYLQKFTTSANAVSEPYVEKTENVEKMIENDAKIYCCGKAAKSEFNLDTAPKEPDIKIMHQLTLRTFATNPSEEFLLKTLEPLYLHKPLAKPKKS